MRPVIVKTLCSLGLRMVAAILESRYAEQHRQRRRALEMAREGLAYDRAFATQAQALELERIDRARDIRRSETVEFISLGGLGIGEPGVNGAYVLTLIRRMQTSGLMTLDMAKQVEGAVVEIADARAEYRRKQTPVGPCFMDAPPFKSVPPFGDYRFALDYLRAYAWSQGKLGDMNRIEAAILDEQRRWRESA